MKNTKVLILMLALIPCALYSQKIFNIDGTGYVGYTQAQNDFIYSKLKQLRLYKISDSLTAEKNKNLLSAISIKNDRIHSDSLDKIDCFKIVSNKNEEIMMLKSENKTLTQSLKSANKDIRKQKVYKWIAIIAGTASTSYLGYKYITK